MLVGIDSPLAVLCSMTNTWLMRPDGSLRARRGQFLLQLSLSHSRDTLANRLA